MGGTLGKPPGPFELLEDNVVIPGPGIPGRNGGVMFGLGCLDLFWTAPGTCGTPVAPAGPGGGG